jgi:hypothetical protein
MTEKQKIMLFLGRQILKNRDLTSANNMIAAYRILAFELFPATGMRAHTLSCDCNVCDGCGGIWRMYNIRLANHFMEFDK